MELNQQQFKDVLFAFLPFIIIRQYVVSEVVDRIRKSPSCARKVNSAICQWTVHEAIRLNQQPDGKQSSRWNKKMSVVDRETSRIINTWNTWGQIKNHGNR